MRGCMRLLLVGSSVFLSACATIMNEGYVKVPVQTNPGDATIKVEGRVYTSPAVVQITRGKKDVVLTVEKEGYKTEKVRFERTLDGWYWGNFILFPISIPIGVPIDFGSGRAYKVKPDSVSFQLTPVEVTQQPKLTSLGNNPISLRVQAFLTNQNWFPLSQEDMLAAVSDEALSVLSQSGRFRFVRSKKNKLEQTQLESDDSLGSLRIDLSLVEKIEVAKLRISVEMPHGATYMISESETLSGKNQEEIYKTLERLGGLVAKRVLGLFGEKKS